MIILLGQRISAIIRVLKAVFFRLGLQNKFPGKKIKTWNGKRKT
jgi:hypothetical protein